MSKLLVINSSPMGDKSVTRQLTARLVEQYKAQNSDVEIIERDTSAMNLPHLDGEILGSFFTPEEDRNEAQKEHSDRSLTLIQEIKEADAIVIGAPMHNFGIPSGLKAYVDHVFRAAETFKYTENGPVGLLENKPAYIISARGGDYSENGFAKMDFVLPYLESVLNFLGVKDTFLIQANNVAISDEALQDALSNATKDIEKALAA